MTFKNRLQVQVNVCYEMNGKRNCLTLEKNKAIEKIAIEKIKHFISKDALNIDGLGKKVVEKFWEKNLIRYPQDIFKLNFNKIKNLEGWGAQSVANLKYSIEQSKKITFHKFIFALGIRHIGQENAKLIAKHLQ